MEEKAIAKQVTESTATVHEVEQVSSELHKVGMYTTAAFAGGIGIWGVICLASAFTTAGGPIALVKSLFGAIFGTM